MPPINSARSISSAGIYISSSSTLVAAIISNNSSQLAAIASNTIRVSKTDMTSSLSSLLHKMTAIISFDNRAHIGGSRYWGGDVPIKERL